MTKTANPFPFDSIESEAFEEYMRGPEGEAMILSCEEFSQALENVIRICALHGVPPHRGMDVIACGLGYAARQTARGLAKDGHRREVTFQLLKLIIKAATANLGRED